LTKTELARRAGITAETLIRVERLQRATSASTLSKLATALEMPTPLLMHGKSDPLDMPRCALMSGTPATDPPWNVTDWPLVNARKMTRASVV
jgi:transcriptional regulator with XRE-family HTH domain